MVRPLSDTKFVVVKYVYCVLGKLKSQRDCGFIEAADCV